MRNHCSLFSFTLPLSYIERRFAPKHNPHLSKCRKYFRTWEVLGICLKKPVRLGGCNRAYCRIQKAREDIIPRSPLVAGAWRAQVHWVDLAWRVFCYLCTPTLFSRGSIIVWRAAERFFTEFFGFLFDNTFWCYLVVASLFPYSCALLLFFVVHVYKLE